ncbi:sporulation lipoprotein, YhcN/YlaJ family [Lentibacillus halodurans]|uniref:Sporulation lipoprotein, YhcN/YlaJ family n=1 Tax=Lentibacillus halodurans TaxID=237679 RepID=A0A1I0Z147_9BACI|nr:YhcN/YlaJ family sporulation lipoprotein [Lentibacillus halodurans]SFB18340.1 sporulation lipoprotein, YhcN/YlaJ family [Lentibacillus halodurans]
MLLRLGILSFLSFTLLIGCQQNQEEQSLPEETDNNERFIQVEDSDPVEQQQLTNNEIASHLANVASDVPDVQDATSVVAGPYAVVGIDVDKDLDRSRVGSIKYSVLEALQKDPYGKTAVVVADGDAVERIRSMGDKVAQGYPVQGVVDELSAIVGRYMPDFPINEDRPDEGDQNKESIPENEEQQLDDVEEEQSNHHNDE